MTNGCGIKNLLDEACEIIGNPIMMFDTSYTLLTNTDVKTDDWVWNEIIALGTFSHETVDFFKQEGFIEAFATSETAVLLESEHLKYKRVNGKIFDKDNVQLGNINVTACKKPFSEGDMELIELLCEILSVELQNSEFYQKIDRVYQEALINRIISGNVTESEITESDNDTLEKLYNGLKSNIYLAIVDITEYDSTNTHMAYFRDLFRKIQSEHKYFIHLNNIVFIISTDNEFLDVKTELNKLSIFFKKYKILCGISSRFQNIFQSNKYIKEAVTALNYGLDSIKEQNIFVYDDFRIEHFLYAAVEDATEICCPVISSIQRYDKENNTVFLDILHIYLIYGMNLLLASAKLKMTTKELSDKLKEIETIFKIDWTNGDILCNIYLSIKFLNK